MGDFYEMFYEDAVVAARGARPGAHRRAHKGADGAGIPMCGVPFHAADGYLAQDRRRGSRVAICEQVEDPTQAKGLVKREVVRVVTPGTLTDGNYLDRPRAPVPDGDLRCAGPPNARPGDALASRAPGAFGLALIDLSTGEFRAAEDAARPRAGARRRVWAGLRPARCCFPRRPR